MSGLINISPDENDQDHWSVNDLNLFDLLKLLVRVIPVAYIFRCKDHDEQIRLIIITDQHQYQDSNQTKMLLDFVKLGNYNIHLMSFCYGTMLDFLRRGHLFFSANCISTNCIFKKKGVTTLPDRSNILTKLKEGALRILIRKWIKCPAFIMELSYTLKKINLTWLSLCSIKLANSYTD